MIFTVLALSGAVVASYTDLKHGVIPNKLTLSLFATGLIGNLLLNGRGVILPLLSSVALIFLLGYGFWVVGGWSAGDAKEFLFLAALLPEYPTHLEGVFSPALGPYPFVLTVFVNTFVAIFPFILLWGIYTAFKQEKLPGFLAPVKEVKETGQNAIVFTGAVLLTLLLHIPTVFAIPIIILAYKFTPRVKLTLSILIALLFLIRTSEPSFIARHFAGVFLVIIIFRLFWNAISAVRKSALRETVSVKDASEGMVLSEAVDTGEGKIETKASGLTDVDVKRLKELHGQGKLEVIRIKKTTPFAPVILMGLLISLTVGDMIMVVSNG